MPRTYSTALSLASLLICLVSIISFNPQIAHAQSTGPTANPILPAGSPELPDLPAISDPNVYFVSPTGDNANPGTIDRPWRIVLHASKTMRAGDTAYFREGVYAEKLRPDRSGNPGQYITFASYPGETAVLDGGENENKGSAATIILISGQQYVRVSGFRIINSGYQGVNMSDSGSIIIDNNEFYNLYAGAVWADNTDGIIIHGNDIQKTTHGIGSSSRRSSDGTGIAPQEHISMEFGARNFEIRYNKISNPHIAEGKYRASKEGIDVKQGAREGKIYGNHVEGIRAMAIYVDGYIAGVSDIEIFNNTGTDNMHGIVIVAEEGGTVENISVYNNIMYKNGYLRYERDTEPFIIGGAGVRIAAYDEGGPTNDVFVYNNTLADNEGCGLDISNSDSNNIQVHNNISYNNADGASCISVSSVDESNTLSSDPSFVDASANDYRLNSGSAAIDASSGTYVPLFDFTWTTRDASPDIGAYEFGASGPLPTPQPTTPPDPSPTLEPTGSGCGADGDLDCSGEVNLFDLSILLRNFGSANPEADIDGSGEVNLFDLSTLLKKLWE